MACLISSVCIHGGRDGGVQALAIGKELEPALLFRDDLRDVEFTQLQ